MAAAKKKKVEKKKKVLLVEPEKTPTRSPEEDEAQVNFIMIY